MSRRSAGADVAPVLLCFDGSDHAAYAIAKAGRFLAPRPTVVLTGWEPIRAWEPWNPSTISSAPPGRLIDIDIDIDIDKMVADVARDKAEHGTNPPGSLGSMRPISHSWERLCHRHHAHKTSGAGRAGSHHNRAKLTRFEASSHTKPARLSTPGWRGP